MHVAVVLPDESWRRILASVLTTSWTNREAQPAHSAQAASELFAAYCRARAVDPADIAESLPCSVDLYARLQHDAKVARRSDAGEAS